MHPPRSGHVFFEGYPLSKDVNRCTCPYVHMYTELCLVFSRPTHRIDEGATGSAGGTGAVLGRGGGAAHLRLAVRVTEVRRLVLHTTFNNRKMQRGEKMVRR